MLKRANIESHVPCCPVSYQTNGAFKAHEGLMWMDGDPVTRVHVHGEPGRPTVIPPWGHPTLIIAHLRGNGWGPLEWTDPKSWLALCNPTRTYIALVQWYWTYYLVSLHVLHGNLCVCESPWIVWLWGWASHPKHGKTTTEHQTMML